METTETQQLPEPSPKRLRRTPDDKVIAGVCGGLGRYFGVDAIFFRIGAIALAFIGGAGILLYLAALLLMPSEDGAAPVATGDGRNRGLVIAGVVVLLLIAWPFLLGGGFILAGIGIPLALLVGAGVLVWWLVSGEGPSGDPKDVARRAALGVGVLALCGVIAVAGAFAAAAAPEWVVATLVIASALAILAGAFVKPVRWLVPPALTLALVAGAVTASGIDLDGGVGDRDYRPATTADMKDTYQLGMGQLVIDLRETDLPAGDVPLRIDLGVGDAQVIVPDDVCVATSADVGIGNVAVFGLDNGGIDVDFDERPDAAPATTRLLVEADVGLGEVRVEDDWFGLDDDNSACLATGERANG